MEKKIKYVVTVKEAIPVLKKMLYHDEENVCERDRMASLEIAVRCMELYNEMFEGLLACQIQVLLSHKDYERNK